MPTVQEENEEAEEANEMVEDSDAGSSQDEAFETEDRVKLVGARG